MNGAATCQECGSHMRIKSTNHGGGVTFRIAECDCGQRWELEERRVRRLPAVSVRVQPYTAVESRPPPPTAANPSASAGGVGGALPGLPIDLPVSDPNPKVSLLSGTRARAGNKPDANSPHRAMVAHFVERWEERYGDKYPFEPKEGAQLAAMIRKHPHLVERWPDMVERFLTSSFWAEKRHPLMGLVTRPVEFSGETNGVPVSQKVVESRKVAASWMRKGA